MNVVRDFILIVVTVKRHRECSERYPFNSNEIKQRSDRSQLFDFNRSEVKQHSECSQ